VAVAVFECFAEALEANDVGVPGRVAQQCVTVASHASCTGLRMSELSTNVPIRKVDVVAATAASWGSGDRPGPTWSDTRKMSKPAASTRRPASTTLSSAPVET